MAKLISLKSYATRAEAEIAKQFLESNGIRSLLSADDAGGMRHDLLMATGGAKLLCEEKDRDEALALLNQNITNHHE